MGNKIIVIDFGSQLNNKILSCIKNNFNIGCVMVPPSKAISTIKKNPNIKAIIFSGSPKSVYAKDAYTIDKQIYTLGLPILGICYGAQLIAWQHGGKVSKGVSGEFGPTDLEILPSALTSGLNANEKIFMSRGDYVTELPKDFTNYASSELSKHVIFTNEKKKIYAVQFHPEADHSTCGIQIFRNFIEDICNIRADSQYSDKEIKQYINQEVKKIKQQVGKDKVICALSGGVDSSVAAVLVHKAIGDQLTCVFVDHGLLRENEAVQVEAMFKKHIGIKNFIKINAQKRFLSALKGVTDPEQKRKIIGRLFIDEFDKYGKKIKGLKWLVQGTLYTDIIESGTKTSHKIKSHHNVGGLPENMKLKIIEPLKLLFKDEVRKVGRTLGLDESVVGKQPFPGPGLAVRIIGGIDEEKLRIVRQSDAILRAEIDKINSNKKIWQFFTMLPNVLSVGVKGDERSYEHVIVIRAVESKDGLTATFADVPYNVLTKISNRITNEVKGVNRVVYDITSKPPGTIEWE